MEASRTTLVLEPCSVKLEEASHEMVILEAFFMKSGSLAGNARFWKLL